MNIRLFRKLLAHSRVVTQDGISLANLAAIGDGKIIVGAASTGKGTARTLSGDGTLSPTGALAVNSLSGMVLPSATKAAAGSSQTDATALVEGFNQVTAANGTKGVKLPAAAAGKTVIIKNTVLNQVLKLYPGSSDKIEGGAANAVVLVPGGETLILVAFDDEYWYLLPQKLGLKFTNVNGENGTGTVQAQVVDASLAAVAGRFLLRAWVSASSYGAPTAITGFAVTTGSEVEEVTENEQLVCLTDATGKIILTLADNGTHHVMVELQGVVHATSITITTV